MKLLFSITAAATYGISLRLLFVSFGDLLSVMSVTFFFIVPFMIGYLTIWLLPYRERHTEAGAFFKPSLTCLVILVVTYLSGMEGMICWIMAFPLFCIAAGFGGMVAFGRKRMKARRNVEWDFEKDDDKKPGGLLVSLLFFIPLFAGVLEGNLISTSQQLHIERHVDIDAAPEMVWKALTASHADQRRAGGLSLCGVMGFPRHLRTTLDTLAVGKQRIAIYEKGLTFVETINSLDPGRRLAVTITNDPSKISKAVMDEHIVIGGEHIRMQGDTYSLEPIAGGGTRLSLVGCFDIHTPFNWYAGLWADWLMSDVISDELESVRQRCSRQAASWASFVK